LQIFEVYDIVLAAKNAPVLFAEKKIKACEEIAANDAELRFREAPVSAVGRKRSMQHQI